MPIVYANISPKNQKTMASYWQYHIDRATGKMPQPNFNFDRLVPLSPRGIKVWQRAIDNWTIG